MPTLAFARELLTEQLWGELTPLLHAHWKEIATFQDIPLSPARDVYEASEAAGILRVYTVRDPFVYDTFPPSSNALLGYAVFFVRPAPHYSTSIQAVQDILFLDPSVRGGTGYRFIAWCDEQLAAEGCQVVAQHVKIAHDFGALLERQGYECVERIFVKRLDRLNPVGIRSVATQAYRRCLDCRCEQPLGDLRCGPILLMEKYAAPLSAARGQKFVEPKSGVVE